LLKDGKCFLAVNKRIHKKNDAITKHMLVFKIRSS